MDQGTTRYEGRPQPKRHCVRWGPSSLSPKMGQRPQLSTNVYCGQKVRWIKVPLGMEVGLASGHIVLDEDPIFGPCLLWPNGWMDQDATSYEGRSRPRPHFVTWGPSSPLPKRGTAPNFRPMSIVAKRSPTSTTAEHVLQICLVTVEIISIVF